jgi:hypothetical protein
VKNLDSTGFDYLFALSISVLSFAVKFLIEGFSHGGVRFDLIAFSSPLSCCRLSSLCPRLFAATFPPSTGPGGVVPAEVAGRYFVGGRHAEMFLLK